jgi:hypothetical protein
LSELPSADLKTIGILALCFVVGFVIIWTWLNARSEDKKADQDSRTERREP